MMSSSAGQYLRRILSRQAIIGLIAFSATALLAPLLIVIEWDISVSVFWVGGWIALLALISTTVISTIQLSMHRRVIERLLQETPAAEPDEIEALAALPGSL